MVIPRAGAKGIRSGRNYIKGSKPGKEGNKKGGTMISVVVTPKRGYTRTTQIVGIVPLVENTMGQRKEFGATFSKHSTVGSFDVTVIPNFNH